jgi:hypothetical protein
VKPHIARMLGFPRIVRTCLVCGAETVCRRTDDHVWCVACCKWFVEEVSAAGGDADMASGGQFLARTYTEVCSMVNENESKSTLRLLLGRLGVESDDISAIESELPVMRHRWTELGPKEFVRRVIRGLLAEDEGEVSK